jgi:hypothetical protein
VKNDGKTAAEISNQVTAEFQIARTSLLVGMMKTLEANRKSSLPLKTFEVSDVVLQDPSKDVGTKNNRRVCAAYCNHTSGFDVYILPFLSLLLLLPSFSFPLLPQLLNFHPCLCCFRFLLRLIFQFLPSSWFLVW